MISIIFLIGLLFLIIYTYLDLKDEEIDDMFIAPLYILGFVLLVFNFSFSLLTCFILWFLVGAFLFYKDAIGGADVKILNPLSIFYLIISPNIFYGQLIFLIIFGIVGTFYGLFSRQIINKSEIPFLPAITLSYIFYYVFLVVSNQTI